MSDITKFNSQLQVAQTATFDGSLQVSGTATFSDQVAIVATNDTVSIVATGISITGTTTITGKVCIYGNHDIEGDVTITGTVTISSGGLRADTIKVGDTERVTKIHKGTQQYYGGNISGNSVATFNITVTGLSLANFNVIVIDTPDILNSAFIADGVVTADDIVSVKIHNTSNGTVEAITATYHVLGIELA